MPNTLYPTGRSRFANGGADWDSDTFRVYLLSDDYTYSDTHEYGASLVGILGTPQTLTGCTVTTDGICDCDGLSYPDVEIGDIVTRIVILKWTGSLATSPLIYYADTNNDTTPIYYPGNGSGIPMNWAEFVFKL